MKALVCEMCGSNDLVKQDGVFVCQSCGTKYSVEEAKKMMVEIDGKVDVSGSTVKVDTSKELENLYKSARRAWKTEDYKTANKYYEMILGKDSDSWEAYCYSVFSRAHTCKIGEIKNTAESITSCLYEVCPMIQKSSMDKSKQIEAIRNIVNESDILATLLYCNAKNHYEGISPSIKSQFTLEYIENWSACMDILYAAGDIIHNKYDQDESLKELMLYCWKEGVDLNLKEGGDITYSNTDEHGAYIQQYDPSYDFDGLCEESKKVHKTGCYVATCVYGSYDCPEVWTLRRFRDYYLDNYSLGRMFIKVYYAISPKVVKIFGNNKLFKRFNKYILDKWVTKLNNSGYDNTQYNDKY